MRTTEQTGAAPHADGPTVAIIVGSTRPGRKADTWPTGSMTSPPLNIVVSVQYTEAALRATGSRLAPALVTDLHSLAAKAYARMGDAHACHAHLRQCERVAARLGAADGSDEVSYVLPGLLETQTAEALRRLGDLTAAHTYATESVRTATATHQRGQVHRYAGLALILAQRGDPDRAVHTADQMLDRAVGIESGRIRDRVGQVIHALRPRGQDPAVAGFLERAAEHLHLKDT